METVKTFSTLFDLPVAGSGKPGMVALFPGSGGPLDLALMSNIGPNRPLVYGDPSYEQGPRAADAMGAPKFPVKLTPTYAHDVRAMLAAHPSPGAYYIVNPNNPTGTMTPREDIVWLLKNKPKGSVVIVDEAYFHFSNDESVIPLVMDNEDLMVTRTFSKIYGMAGLRAGVVIAHLSVSAPSPRLLLRHAAWEASRSPAPRQPMPACWTRALFLRARRSIRISARKRSASSSSRATSIIPDSQANFFMVDVKRPGRVFQQQMLGEKVAIGRTWAALPTYVRVTVGTKPEMEKFQTAFVKCMDMKPASSTQLGASLHLPDVNHIPMELYRG